MVTRIVSCDSHVELSHGDVKKRLATRFHDAYDRAVDDFNKSMVQETPTGRLDVNSLIEGTHPASGRAGHYDPSARVHDMDTDGIDVEVMYCEVSAFRYLYLLEHGAREATQAFNDTLHDFSAVNPHRLVVSYQIPIHDIDDAVAEVERVVTMGARSLQFPVFPADLGFPDYYDVRYDRLFSAIQESGLPICCHIGLKSSLDDVTRRDPTPQKAVMGAMVMLNTSEAFGMWILGGVLERFPRLKLVFVEAGLGWVPFWLEKIDDMKQRRGYEFPALTELPSSYFHRQVCLSFIDEPIALNNLRYELGIENIMWSSDYPHPTSSWPNSSAIIERQFQSIPEEERELILGGNATRIWRL
jgi:uncharacterized protein